MHKTLKIEALRPVKGNLAAQQRAFSAFRAEFNSERPHEALKGATPSSAYTPRAPSPPGCRHSSTHCTSR
jgi:putative transposase